MTNALTRPVIIAAALLMPALAHGQADDKPPPPRRTTLTGLNAPVGLHAEAPANDDGRHIQLTWDKTIAEGDIQYLVFRNPYSPVSQPPLPPPTIAVGDWLDDWQLIGIVSGTSFKDDVTASYVPEAKQVPQVWSLTASEVAPRYRGAADDPTATRPAADRATSGRFVYAVRASRIDASGLISVSAPVITGAVQPKTAYFNTDTWFFFLVIVLMAIALYYFFKRITADPHSVFIRRIPGVDAIEDAVGRSTEMGRPVLYVTGTDDIQNIQTIASLLVLGRVAEMTAEYDTEIKVANLYPLTMVVAEEIVRQGFADAGRIDAHKPENVMFISSEQFAFAAGVNGLILRDRPATNIYLGRYFAESLILAETGYVTGAVQIAGTAAIPQLPFFIAACDYTLIGEELYAVSAYLTREPGLLALLKATDLVKVLLIILIFIGFGMALFDAYDLGSLLVPQ